MKKLLAFLLAAGMIASFAACGESAPAPANETEAPAADTAADAAAAETEAETAAPETEPETEAETEAPAPAVYNISGLELYTQYVDVATVSTVATGFSGEGPTNVFDESFDTKWCVRPTEFGDDDTLWLEWGMKRPVTVKAYVISTANDEETRNPEKWTLSARNSDSEDWVVIDTVESGNLPFDYLTDSDPFEVDAPGAYQFYQLHFTENMGADIYQFSEFKMYGDALPFDDSAYNLVTDKVASVESLSVGYDNEGCENVFDGDTDTKWCTRPGEHDQETLVLDFKMSEPVELAGYIFTTANDAEDRNPEVWTLSARNNDTDEWTVIDTVTAGDLPFDYFTDSKFFAIDNPGIYTDYRLEVTDNMGGIDCFQFSELKLYTNK